MHGQRANHVPEPRHTSVRFGRGRNHHVGRVKATVTGHLRVFFVTSVVFDETIADVVLELFPSEGVDVVSAILSACRDQEVKVGVVINLVVVVATGDGAALSVWGICNEKITILYFHFKRNANIEWLWA